MNFLKSCFYTISVNCFDLSSIMTCHFLVKSFVAVPMFLKDLYNLIFIYDSLYTPSIIARKWVNKLKVGE